MKWDYVPNQNGGFLGMSWHIQDDKECRQYLQLEENKLCFKIRVKEKQNRKALRSVWYKRIKNENECDKFLLKRPDRFGSGKYMTVCIYNGDYRIANDDGLLDVRSTVSRLKKAEKLLKSLAVDL